MKPNLFEIDGEPAFELDGIIFIRGVIAEKLYELFNKALQEARNTALDDAIKICNTMKEPYPKGCEFVDEACAEAIKALKGRE